MTKMLANPGLDPPARTRPRLNPNRYKDIEMVKSQNGRTHRRQTEWSSPRPQVLGFHRRRPRGQPVLVHGNSKGPTDGESLHRPWGRREMALFAGAALGAFIGFEQGARVEAERGMKPRSWAWLQRTGHGSRQRIAF